MGEQYVHLSNGYAFKTFMDDKGVLRYKNKEGKTRKVGKNQKVILVLPDEAQGDWLKLPTDSELFRHTSLPSAKKIWRENNKIDKYTGFSQSDTEEITFEDLSKVVTEYEDYDKKRAIRVERDHTVEVQMVKRAWDRANNGMMSTRATVRCIRDSVNHLDNLNCTPGAVNMKKQSAVRTSLRDYESENGNGLRQNLLDYGVRRNTTRRICTAFEKSAHQIADKVQNQGRDVYDHFADEITSMIGYMKLED